MLATGRPATVRGVNVVGLRRAGMSPADRRTIQDVHRLLYREGLPPRAALDRIRQEIPPTPYVLHLVEFVETARRGICGPPRRAVPVETEETL
jgi:UDP-N-acetylglucosamine acyltransferase